MKEKIIVVYNEGTNEASALEWMERHDDVEIVAVNFSNDDAFLLSNSAMIVGVKKVYLIDLMKASPEAMSKEDFVASKLFKIAEKENASTIAAGDETCISLQKHNHKNSIIKITSLVS